MNGKILRQDEALDMLRTFWERTIEEREVTPIGPQRAALDDQEVLLAELWDDLHAVQGTAGKAFLFDFPDDVVAALSVARKHHVPE